LEDTRAERLFMQNPPAGTKGEDLPATWAALFKKVKGEVAEWCSWSCI